MKNIHGLDSAMKKKPQEELDFESNMEIPKIFPILPDIISHAFAIKIAKNCYSSTGALKTWKPNLAVTATWIDMPKAHDRRIQAVTYKRIMQLPIPDRIFNKA